MEKTSGFLKKLPSDNRILHTSYANLNKGNIDIGFQSRIKDGEDYHQVTRDITLSIQKFQDGRLIHMFYTNGQPLFVELDDAEIIPYYSDYVEWRYVMSGELGLAIDGEIVHFSEGEICFINSSALHRESVSYSECVIINIFINQHFFNERFISNISLTPLQKFLHTNLSHRGQVEKYLKFAPHPENAKEVQKYIFLLMNEIRFQKSGYLDISRGYIIRMMDLFAVDYRYKFSGNETVKYKDTLFLSVSDFLRQNISSVTMKTLTEHFHFQANFFNNLIKQYTGLTYSEYLISLRIDRAKELLESTDLSVDEIIWLVGYQNKGFFYRRFTNITGISPAKYRKKVNGRNAG